ncbi:MAG TPA: amidohydrolase [Acidimicrobiales bacterium]
MKTWGLDDLKARACEIVEEWADRLIELSHDIHAHPELCFEERHAHDACCDLLDAAGLVPLRHAGGLDTAFTAEAGAGDATTVAICCEYDALPEIGHACGHNIIATAGLGAGIAAAAVADDARGRVRIVGTPAEEGGGGKILLARAGVFDGCDAAMMVHPAGADLATMDVIATAQIKVDYRGRAAHAAAAPQKGRNALDAAVLGYMGVAALRQHIGPRERIHGIFTKGGDQPNIVPDHTEMLWYVRAATAPKRDELQERVLAALEAGAAATGCTMGWDVPGLPFSDMWHSRPLVEAWMANASATGRQVLDGTTVSASTDMGDLSRMMPSIHPMIGVAPPDISIHSAEFAHYAASPEGDRAVVDGAKALAMTAIDFWTRPDLRQAAAAEFARKQADLPPGVVPTDGPPGS